MTEVLQDLGYVFDAQSRVWSKPDYVGINYSDGDETELRISEIIAQSDDLTVLSKELRQCCIDWASTYHLSGTRANILRPFNEALTGDILEIGAGCGAITRYLGECGANVLALEGSMRRAAIARSRTRDLTNVTVLAEKFDEFQYFGKFDVITLIGVLEYANLFTCAENPPISMLRRAHSLLKPNGKLIIAIENQLGLKYFAGAPEDHLGQPMYGIEGRYRKNQPQTFGRKVLAGILKDVGFDRSEFLAAFPDYKLPVSIITERGLATDHFDAGAFAWQSARRDPQLPPFCAFSLELAWPEIFRNGLAMDFANSFLILATSGSEYRIDQGTLAYHYSTDRVPEYCKETRFDLTGLDDLRVHYRRLDLSDDTKANDQDSVITFICPESAKYAKGQTLSWDFVQIVTRDGWTFEEVGQYLKRYAKLLQFLSRQTGKEVILESSDAILPGSFFDFVPQNIVVNQDGSAEVIDTEWCLNTDIKFGRLLFRSLLLMLASVTRFGMNTSGYRFSRFEFVSESLRAAGFSVSEQNYLQFIEDEAIVQELVTGLPAQSFLSWWPDSPLPLHNLAQAITERDGQIANLSQMMDECDGQIANLSQAMAERDGQIASLSQAMAERDGQIGSLGEAITERDGRIAGLRQEIAERDGRITEFNQILEKHDRRIRQLAADLEATLTSTSWKITRPLRYVGHQMKRARHLWFLMPQVIQHGGGLKGTAFKAINVFFREGLRGIKHGLVIMQEGRGDILQGSWDDPPPLDRNNYIEWVRRYDTLDHVGRNKLRNHLRSMTRKPLISVLMPTYNPKPEWLEEAIESVRRQIYPNWELCIADDASSDPRIRETLRKYSRKDKRINIACRQANGHISAATNSALELAAGEYVALLDHDDLLSEHALFWVAEAINRTPNARLIYSDEDKLDINGRRFDPYFKCEWNPDLFLSHNMICHLGAYSTELVRKLGGFRVGYEGAQDYDLALRCIEVIKPEQIVHIPRVLYHWRMHPESTSSSSDAKPYAVLAGEMALNEHLTRCGVRGCAESTPFRMYRIRYELPDPLPRVSLIIPTRNGFQLVRQCVESILTKTTYSDYEILIVDNGSDDPDTLQYFQSLKANPSIRVLRDESPFNYSSLNNKAVREANGQVIGLLNNDLEVIAPEWLNEMVAIAMQPGVGAVGARLWYPNDTLQHGGVILGVGGVAGHSHKHIERGLLGYVGRASLMQSLSAVTAACLVIRKEIYQSVGGLDEVNLPVAFNDVDFCLKVREAGYRNVWTPYAELYHHESASRGKEDTPEKRSRAEREILYMKARWGRKLLADPAYSPNLTLDHEDFSYSWPPRVSRLPS